MLTQITQQQQKQTPEQPSPRSSHLIKIK